MSCNLFLEVKHCQFEPIDGWYNEKLTIECLPGFWFSRGVYSTVYRCSEDSSWVAVDDHASVIATNSTVQCVGMYTTNFAYMIVHLNCFMISAL